jgi:drug/metabolite transporter (DMT)-like permease
VEDRRAAWRADGLLLLTAVLWGSGFVAQRAGSEHLGPLAFNAARYVIAAVALTPVALRWGLQRPAGGAPPWHTGAAGLAAGVVLFAAGWLQQAGVGSTTAGNAGFITGLYVVLVPFLAWLRGGRLPASTWPAAALALLGLYLLSVTGDWSLGRGDALVLASAVLWAVHVLLVARFAPWINGILLAWLQMAVSAVLSLVLAFAFEAIPWIGIRAAFGPILYNGLVCGAVAFTLQILGQRHAPPAHAAILMSLEAVFAAFFGWWLLGERLGARGLAGCAFMFLGMAVSQWPVLRQRAASGA